MPKMYKPGTFLRVPLGDGSFGYGRVLKAPHDAFYEHRTQTPDSDLDRISSKRILFTVAIRHQEKSSWEAIGWRELEGQMTQPIIQFLQEFGNFRRCTILDTGGGSRNAEPPECIGLERLAVWEEVNVEERLLDAFMGRPNDTVERFKVRLQ